LHSTHSLSGAEILSFMNSLFRPPRPNPIICVMLGRLVSNCREQEQGQSRRESFRVDSQVSRIFASVRGNAVYDSTIRFPCSFPAGVTSAGSHQISSQVDAK
jgi:hypothetical protein